MAPPTRLNTAPIAVSRRERPGVRRGRLAAVLLMARRAARSEIMAELSSLNVRRIPISGCGQARARDLYAGQACSDDAGVLQNPTRTVAGEVSQLVCRRHLLARLTNSDATMSGMNTSPALPADGGPLTAWMLA